MRAHLQYCIQLGVPQHMENISGSAGAFQYLKEAYKKGREGFLTRMYGDRTREKGFKLKLGRFRLNM